MSFTHINFNWPEYFSMLAFVTLWILGFFAVTRKGKIGYFVLEFLEKKKTVTVNLNPTENMEIDSRIYESATASGSPAEENVEWVMDSEDVMSEITFGEIWENIKQKKPNEYFKLTQKQIIPTYFTHPIATCITCMSSFHSLVLYTAYCIFYNINYHDFDWNIFEWIIIAVPCAFLGEFFWYLRKALNHFAK